MSSCCGVTHIVSYGHYNFTAAVLSVFVMVLLLVHIACLSTIGD